MTTAIALTEHTENPTVQAIEEAAEFTPDYKEINDTLVNFYANYTMLTQNQKLVLISMIRNLVSERKQADTDLASELGIHYNTVYNCRANLKFQEVLSQISVDLIRGKVEGIIGNLFEQSKTKTSAAELLLKVSGLYIPKMQSAVLHANAGDIERAKTPDAAISGIVTQLGQLNMTKERIIQLVSDTYDRLKAEGAF